MLIASFAFGVGGAQAATVHVETSGSDDSACGASSAPCETVAQGVTNASSGDTVSIGSGTFSVTNINIGAKDLEITGASRSSTILDGENSTNLSSGGMLRFAGTGTTTATVRDLTMRNAGRPASGGVHIAIFAVPPVGSAVNLTVSSVTVRGSNDTDSAIYSFHNAGTLDVDHLDAGDIAGNAILLERHTGAATISRSKIVTTNSDTAIFAMNYSEPTPVTGKLTIAQNVIDASNAVGISSGLGSAPAVPFNAGVEISNNLLRPDSATTNLISASNASPDAGGGAGDIRNLKIADNRADGVGVGTGIRILGKITTPRIKSNHLRKFAVGVNVVNGAAGDGATGAVVTQNRLVNNSVGLSNEAAEMVNAANNWWGCNAGPGLPGCNPVAGGATTSPNVVLTLSANPMAPAAGGGSYVTPSVATNSLGQPVTEVFRNGVPVQSTATGGSALPPAAPLIEGVADVSFLSSASTGRSVSSTIDNQTVTLAFDDAPTPPPPPPDAPYDRRSVAAHGLLRCLDTTLLVTDVSRRSGRVRVSGGADPLLAGKTVKIYYLPQKRRVAATARVAKDGSFSALALRPFGKDLRTGRARYRATLEGKNSPWLKLNRRLELTKFSVSNDTLVVRGRLLAPFRRGEKLALRRQDACGKSTVVARMTVRSDGSFSGNIALGPGLDLLTARLNSLVLNATNRRTYSTFSIARPVFSD
ncbi:MAG: hypothetical protein ACRDKE_04715 [Solirubrobacterales bacterium]